MRRIPLLLLAGLTADIASIIWVGQATGVVVTLVLLFAGGVIGISLMKSAGTSVLDALRSPLQGTSLPRDLGSLALSRMGAGILFLVPGFFSDVLGALLLLPPIRRWLASRVPVRAFGAAGPAPSGAGRFERVIEVDAVEITSDRGPLEKPQEPR